MLTFGTKKVSMLKFPQHFLKDGELKSSFNFVGDEEFFRIFLENCDEFVILNIDFW